MNSLSIGNSLQVMGNITFEGKPYMFVNEILTLLTDNLKQSISNIL